MAGVKELRLRIKSVGNIKQITRAMEMVATTKLRRFQDRATSSRPYTDEISGLVGRLAAMLGDRLADRPLFRQGEGDRTLMLVVTSDRGLCGAYNTTLLREIEAWRETHSRPIDYYVYGRKGFQYMSKRDFNVDRFRGLADGTTLNAPVLVRGNLLLRSAASMAMHISYVIAFSAAGRFSVIRPARPSVRMMTSGALIGPPACGVR